LGENLLPPLTLDWDDVKTSPFEVLHKGSISPLQLSNNTHAVAKVLDEKYETIWEGSSKKENVIIMTPEEITEIKKYPRKTANKQSTNFGF